MGGKRIYFPERKRSISTHSTQCMLPRQGKININNENIYYHAPCTVIIPPNIEHEVFNLGNEPTEHFTILRIGSIIWDTQEQPMNLPWRR
ncbi:MAG: hypothetical protein ACHQUC_10070 [Chlamydiales bacterium]